MEGKLWILDRLEVVEATAPVWRVEKLEVEDGDYL